MKFFGARRIFLFITAAVVLSFSIAFVARAQDNSGYRKVGLKHASRHSSMTAEPGSFETARAAFPAFCSDWERKLKDRERANLSAMRWEEKEGWQTGYYLGYSNILTCECKQSAKGFPIGTLTYTELHYYLVGHTLDEAKAAKPQPVAHTDTTELFRWDRDRWVY